MDMVDTGTVMRKHFGLVATIGIRKASPLKREF